MGGEGQCTVRKIPALVAGLMPDDGSLRRRGENEKRDGGSSGSAPAERRTERRSLRQRQVRRRRAAAVASIAGVGIVVAFAVGGGSASAPSKSRPRQSRFEPDRSHRRPGASNRLLASASYVSVGGGRRREIALTFDDGPGPYTTRVLRVLRRLHAPATFFWVGRWVAQYRSVAAAEVRGGYAIGSHTQTHPPLGRLSLDDQRKEIAQGSGAVESLGLPRPRLFRPPYGSFDQTTLGLLAQRHMLMVLWTVDTRDFSSPGAKRISYLAISGARPGAIILMHDGGGERHQTLAALPKIIRALRQRRYQLVTIPRLLQDDPPPANRPPPRSLAGG